MKRYTRLFIAFAILLSGLALLPQMGLVAGVVGWQRYVGVYEDVVTVLNADYHPATQQLEVRADSSSNGAATLSVYEAASNALIGVLEYRPTLGDYYGSLSWPQAPVGGVLVVSDLGGEAPAPVEVANYLRYLPILQR